MLKEIYRIHLSTVDFPLERVVCNVVDEVYLPERGKAGTMVEVGTSNILFFEPPQYPICSSRGIENLFKCLDLEKVIDLVKYVLLEKKIFLISKHKSLLNDVASGVLSLIFPFEWKHALIPVQPYQCIIRIDFTTLPEGIHRNDLPFCSWDRVKHDRPRRIQL
jgi:hypothetical protein